MAFHGLPIIGYEVKIARSDVQRELKDPSKAEAIGRFADEWWIVISDVSIIDGLVLPATWGVLAPRKNVLHIVRKAKKLKPEPINRALLAALIRNVCGSWVPRAQYNQLAHKQRAEMVRELERDSESVAEVSAQSLKRLRETIEAFEKASGLSIHRWDAGDIGAAVTARAISAYGARRDDLEHSIQQFEHTQEHHAVSRRTRKSRHRHFANCVMHVHSCRILHTMMGSFPNPQNPPQIRAKTATE